MKMTHTVKYRQEEMKTSYKVPVVLLLIHSSLVHCIISCIPYCPMIITDWGLTYYLSRVLLKEVGGDSVVFLHLISCRDFPKPSCTNTHTETHFQLSELNNYTMKKLKPVIQIVIMHHQLHSLLPNDNN